MDASERAGLVREVQQETFEKDEYFLQSRELWELEQIDRDIRGGYRSSGRARLQPLNRRRRWTWRSRLMVAIVCVLFASLAFDALAEMSRALIVFMASGN